MKIKKAILLLSLGMSVFAIGCTKESKVKSSVMKQYETSYNNDLDKVFGKDPKGITLELKDLVKKKMQASITDFKLNGDKCSGTLLVKNIKDDELLGLMFIFGMASAELDKKGIKLKDAFKELKKFDQKAPSSTDELTVVESKYQFNGEKKNDEFVISSINKM